MTSNFCCTKNEFVSNATEREREMEREGWGARKQVIIVVEDVTETKKCNTGRFGRALVDQIFMRISQKRS